MAVGPILEQIIHRNDLSREQAIELMNHLVSGDALEAQIGGVLAALRMKGVTPQELAAFAGVMREHASPIPLGDEWIVDTCGTGGGMPTFNISTAAAFVACAAGAKVAKHGNRAVTSSCGSADVLEALGAWLDDSPEKLAAVFHQTGFTFLFAPHHHPAMRFVGPARRAIGIRTVFNFLGPLSNPARAHAQLIGVFDPAICRVMAEALQHLGTQRALVVHGLDGMDEISPCTTTSVTLLDGDQMQDLSWTPEYFGIEAIMPQDVAPADTVEGNATLLREAISKPDSPRAMAVVPNAGAVLWLAKMAPSARVGAEMAREAIASGAASNTLESWIEATRA